MRADFSHLSRYQPSADRTAEYRLTQIDGEPTLVLAPATADNRPYFNAVLRQSKDEVRRLQAAGVTAESLAERRRLSRELLAQHVLKGWRDVRDRSGAEVAFSPENALGFLRALPDWLFDAVQAFASSPSNFLAPGEAAPSEVAAASGN